MEELEITIDPEGNVTLHVKGVKGPGCMDLTRYLEEAIGEVEERTRTNEYFQDETGPLRDRSQI